MEKNVLHISIGGFPGVGKTTILKILESQYRVHVIPRYTSRPMRPGEKGSREYKFVSKEGFEKLQKEDFFIHETIRRNVEVNRRFYSTAIPHRKHWPEPPKETDFILSFFGSKAPLVRKEVPEMVLVFISLHSGFDAMERLSVRCHEQRMNTLYRFSLIIKYRKEEIWQLYDATVFNDDTPQKCAKEIIERAWEVWEKKHL